MDAVQQAGAIAIRTRDGAVEALVVRSRKDPSVWIFPKGHIAPGESAAEAAVRELQEEAGVDGEIVKPIGMLAFQSGHESVEVTYYLTRFIRTVPQSEDRDVDWLPIAEARQRLSFETARQLLDEAAAVFVSKPGG
jgi:8-oxo-dGTP pyrophosphatase MutT (NUDIX family)